MWWPRPGWDNTEEHRGVLRPGLSVGPDTARQTGEGAKSIRNVGLRGEETRTGLEAGGQGRAREPGNKFLTNYRAESNLWQERRTRPGRISDKVVLQPLSLHTPQPGLHRHITTDTLSHHVVMRAGGLVLLLLL